VIPIPLARYDEAITVFRKAIASLQKSLQLAEKRSPYSLGELHNEMGLTPSAARKISGSDRSLSSSTAINSARRSGTSVQKYRNSRTFRTIAPA